MEELQQLKPQLDYHLANVALNYNPSHFIAGRFFPVVEVPKQSDNHVIFSKKDLFRHENTRRSRGTEANKITTNISNNSYYCNNYALKVEIALEDRINAASEYLMHLEKMHVRRLQEALYLDWEGRLANLCLNRNTQSKEASNSPITVKNPKKSWSRAEANPLDDVLEAIDAIEQNTGYRPNNVLFSGKAWQLFRRNERVIQRSTPVSLAQSKIYPSVEQASTLLETKVLVGNSWVNPVATKSGIKPIWGSNVIVYYTPETASTHSPSFGYSFRWTQSGLPNMQVERHPFNSRTHCYEIEIGYYQDEIITAPDLGCIISNVADAD